MNDKEYAEFLGKYCKWVGDEKVQAKVEVLDRLIMIGALIKYIESVKPIYDKYHVGNVKTANVIEGYDFAESALRGIMKLSDI